jgi:hypothetical protein
MKCAAVIFALAGFTYLALGITSLITNQGTGTGSLPMALVAVALFVQSYALFRSKPRARTFGLITSAALFICFFTIAAVLVVAGAPLQVTGYPQEATITLVAMVGVSLAFGLALISLVRDKRAP